LLYCNPFRGYWFHDRNDVEYFRSKLQKLCPVSDFPFLRSSFKDTLVQYDEEDGDENMLNNVIPNVTEKQQTATSTIIVANIDVKQMNYTKEHEGLQSPMTAIKNISAIDTVKEKRKFRHHHNHQKNSGIGQHNKHLDTARMLSLSSNTTLKKNVVSSLTNTNNTQTQRLKIVIYQVCRLHIHTLLF
jgi:hypothetical protein